MKQYLVPGMVLFIFAGSCTAEVSAQGPPVHGPRLYFHARFWNTPGWQPRDGDYAYLQLTPGPKALDQIRTTLKDIPPKHRMVLSTSIEGMDEILRQLIEREGFNLACLGYDVEGWDLTPDSEKRDPVAACKRGQALAHKYGLKFLVAPTRAYGEKFGDQIARYADIMKVQHKGGQAQNIDRAIEEQRALYPKLRAANPKVVLFHDMAAVPKGQVQTLAQLLRYYRGLADMVDGIGMWALESHRQHVEPFIRAIRPPVGRANSVAPGEGPRMYFFSFLWDTPGWQPRKGDYACAKITPGLKTFKEKLDHVVESLKQIPPEYRMVQFNTLDGAEELLRELMDAKGFRIACLGYDLEEWDLTSATEKPDPIAACKRGQSLANKYKLDFIVTLSNAMSTKWGVKVAPFVLAIKPQFNATHVRTIDEAIEYQRKLCLEIRRANPDIQVFHDVGIQPKDELQNPERLLRYYAGVADLVDGIGVFSQNKPEEIAVMKKYIVGVRPPFREAQKKPAGAIGGDL
jgi:hypothetical protein